MNIFKKIGMLIPVLISSIGAFLIMSGNNYGVLLIVGSLVGYHLVKQKTINL